MSVMSDLDLLYRDGAVSQNDFIERGIEPERAKAFAELVADARAGSFVQRVFGFSRLARDIEAFATRDEHLKGLGLCKCGSELDDGFACLGDCDIEPSIEDDGFYTVYQTAR